MSQIQSTHDAAVGSYTALLSIVNTFLSIGIFISADTRSLISWIIGICSGLVAITAGIVSIRYHLKATKKLK